MILRMKLSEDPSEDEPGSRLDRPLEIPYCSIHANAILRPPDLSDMKRILGDEPGPLKDEPQHPAEKIFDLIETSGEEGITRMSIKKILHCKSSQFYLQS